MPGYCKVAFSENTNPQIRKDIRINQARACKRWRCGEQVHTDYHFNIIIITQRQGGEASRVVMVVDCCPLSCPSFCFFVLYFVVVLLLASL